EHQTEDLERDDAEQRLRVARLAQHHRGVALPLGEGQVALRYLPAHGRAIGEHKLHLPLWPEADAAPHRLRKEGVRRSTVDQEAHGSLGATGTAHDALDVADAHTPEAIGRSLNSVMEAWRREAGIREPRSLRRSPPVAPAHHGTDVPSLR